ncbi:MAG: DEAD/DEAH box helicase family protein [Dehalococcoidia bacterium]
MAQVVIENPILNPPYEEPSRHFRFSNEGITNEIVEERRVSSYFMPIPAPKKRTKQLALDTEWTKDRVEENKVINRIRGRVAQWRKGGYVGITKTTRRLLDYWMRADRERKLFFCQVEALETAIYITEVANKYGDAWIENAIREANQAANPLLNRIAFKMATGAGKTVVMAMMIAWHTLNKIANSQDVRFSDAFLVVTPGITIKDRLRVLLPSDPNNFYRHMDVVPPESMEELHRAKVVITNFHTFKHRERGDAGKLSKTILKTSFTETPDQMVRRACRELGSKRNIIVINDEAHHCYRRPVGGEEVVLKGEERKEVEKREEEARIWISGLEAVKAKIGVKVVYDLSATPFFLRGSGRKEGLLFPWVVSDFSLIDAIESGIVKVPRVPVSDDQMQGTFPTYRDLWIRVGPDLPKKGRKTESVSGEPKLPLELEGALLTLYKHYEKTYRLWESDPHLHENATPPVFIVVCQNTNISKLVFDWIAGWEKPRGDGEKPIVVPGKLELFSNEQGGDWSARPTTILVDSTQLESGEAMSPEFKKAAAAEIGEFKAEYRARFPGRDADALTNEDILREVMNTVGKPGKLGENIRCVVSVSMLTEGWDANTVTHILGVRAFQTQLLCEQVVGRGLRRRSYALNDEGRLDPEYAEVFGVPFSFIPCAGSQGQVRTGRTPTRVRALEERERLEITFPRLIGYRYEMGSETLRAEFSEDSVRVLSTLDVPTKTENAPIVGETVIMTLDDLKRYREQEVAFLLAKLTLEKYFRDDDGSNVKQWLFPQVLSIARRWLQECVTLKDNTFKQLLLLSKLADDASDRIYRAIAASAEGGRTLVPVVAPYDSIGSSRYVDFDTTKDTWQTDAAKCQVSHVAIDSGWEAKMAQALEEMPEVICYVKNQGLSFKIPYTLDGQEKQYYPDFIVRVDDGRGRDEPLNLIIEVTGEKKKDKEAKAATARSLWTAAVNNDGGFGRWAYLEDFDPWNAQAAIREFLVGAAGV